MDGGQKLIHFGEFLEEIRMSEQKGVVSNGSRKRGADANVGGEDNVDPLCNSAGGECWHVFMPNKTFPSLETKGGG